MQDYSERREISLPGLYVINSSSGSVHEGFEIFPDFLHHLPANISTFSSWPSYPEMSLFYLIPIYHPRRVTYRDNTVVRSRTFQKWATKSIELTFTNVLTLGSLLALSSHATETKHVITRWPYWWNPELFPLYLRGRQITQFRSRDYALYNNVIIERIFLRHSAW